MLISYNALKSLIDFVESPEELAARLTDTGLEVEGLIEVLSIPGGLKGLVIGEVKECVPHLNADRLKCTKVDVGETETLSIVCGAPNVAKGQKVIVATLGSTLYPRQGEPFEIKKSKIRGVVSEGMLCAQDEIGLGESHEGILVLKTKLPNGTPAAEYFDLKSDYRIEIGLTPNRADAASHFGVSRDIRAITHKDIRLPDTQNFTLGTAKSTIDPHVENTTACPRFCGLEIRGVQVSESPKWLKQFLNTIGVNSINNLVDITNYICHYLGQPMHIFDADKIRGQKIVVRCPKKGEKLKTLDGIEHTLSGEDLAICDAEGPMAIAGVFGGEKSGVQADTKNIFLEVAYFDPAQIRKTSTAHGIKTDASFRYERGADPNMPPYAIRVAAQMVLDMAGGELCDTLFDHYPKMIENRRVEVKYKNVDRLLGKVLERKLIKSILTSLEIGIEKEENGMLVLSVPPYRVDVSREADIIEEILRIHGFQNIELSESLASGYLSDFAKTDADGQRVRISELLVANGFFEIQNLSIVKPSQNSVLGDAEDTQVKLLNPLTEDLSVMRNSLLFSGLQTIAYNTNRRNADLKLFEFGRIYGRSAQESGFKYWDKQVLGIWYTGMKEAETWQFKNEKVRFFDMKNTFDKVLTGMKVQYQRTEEADDDRFDYGLAFFSGNRLLAVLGKVKTRLLKFSAVKQDVFYAELDWEYALKKHTTSVTHVEIPKFPAVRRDLSLVLNESVHFRDIQECAEKAEKKLLRSINVFDVYKGDRLGRGKKSYSVSFILQDPNRTLNDKQIDKTMERLIAAFESELSAGIRR